MTRRLWPVTMGRNQRYICSGVFLLNCQLQVADKIIEEPRKVWVKLVASGDLVEINLDRDKPARWESRQLTVDSRQ